MSTATKSIFDRFAEQLGASVEEFNHLRGDRALRCERTSNTVAVYKELYPQLTLELEFDDLSGTVRMRRQKVEDPSSRQVAALVSDLRVRVEPKNEVAPDRVDYCRLAWQALRPLMAAFD